VQSNDYEGIDNVFNLYMVLKQEKELTGAKFLFDDHGEQVLSHTPSLNP